jgi:chemotaxis protein MotA
MIIALGWLIAITCALGGYVLLGGHLSALWQPTEFLIIGGAAVGFVVASNRPRVLRQLGTAVPAAFRGQTMSKVLYLDLLCLLFELLNRVRRDGLTAIETDIEDPESSSIFRRYPAILADTRLMEFITDYFRILLGGTMNNVQLENLMEQEIEVHQQHGHAPVQAMQRVADALPAFGIVVAVMGVVHTLGSVGLPPAELGKLIAIALVGTFTGIVLAYSFIGPLASVMEQNHDVELNAVLCVKAVLLAHVNGFTPAVAVEFGRKILFPDLRPSFFDVDEGTRAVRGAR